MTTIQTAAGIYGRIRDAAQERAAPALPPGQPPQEVHRRHLEQRHHGAPPRPADGPKGNPPQQIGGRLLLQGQKRYSPRLITLLLEIT